MNKRTIKITKIADFGRNHEEHSIVDTIIKRIKSNKFDFESVMRKGSFFNKRCQIVPLFCSYGQIGYSIYTDYGNVQYDYELNKIKVI